MSNESKVIRIRKDIIDKFDDIAIKESKRTGYPLRPGQVIYKVLQDFVDNYVDGDNLF